MHVENSNFKGEIKGTLPKIESRPKEVELSQNPLSNHASRLLNNILRGFQENWVVEGRSIRILGEIERKGSRLEVCCEEMRGNEFGEVRSV